MADNLTMPSDTVQRRWIAQWKEARSALRAQRAAELARLSDERALAAADALLSMGHATHLSPTRRTSSGLVRQQALLHRRALP
jgi:hypothetical protein